MPCSPTCAHAPRRPHDQPVAANLLDRQFTAGAPNQRWVGDTTEFVIGESGKARGPRPATRPPKPVSSSRLDRPPHPRAVDRVARPVAHRSAHRAAVQAELRFGRVTLVPGPSFWLTMPELCRFYGIGIRYFTGTRYARCPRSKKRSRDLPGSTGNFPGCDPWWGQRLTRIGRQHWAVPPVPRSEVRRAWGGCPESAHPGPQKPGLRDDLRDTARDLASAASRFPGAFPMTAESARNTTRKTAVSPEQTRSASIGATGWRRGQSPANPSRHEFGQVPAECCTHACAPEHNGQRNYHHAL